ncbi:glycosyltransferase family A protein [Chitinophaga solisilvae]|uniref:glycosyltransferase family A protein n=1 Tax=Chitinophaga solisilvae TaxID=1233460 RepID=UPI00136F8925|nr:glycosyltransferase family A protein [Chitinophaga solisilvae]
MQQPKISCLCISGSRPHLLENTIRCFVAQTYPEKELIIVSRGEDPEYTRITAAFADKGVRYYGVDAAAETTLGELRNIALQQAGGDYFCVWDDDDWHHARRLEIQYNAAVSNAKQGTVLAYSLLYDQTRGEAFLSDPVLPPGTILCSMEALTEQMRYAPINSGEDTHFLTSLVGGNLLFPLVCPVLYIYVFHGSNTVSAAHFSKMVSTALPAGISAVIGDIIAGRRSVEDASAWLSSKEVLRELNYFNPLAKM